MLFTADAPSTLTDELSGHGYEVYEALSISEIFALVEEHPDWGIIITPESDQVHARVIQQHWPTIRLHQRFIPVNVCLN